MNDPALYGLKLAVVTYSVFYFIKISQAIILSSISGLRVSQVLCDPSPLYSWGLKIPPLP